MTDQTPIPPALDREDIADTDGGLVLVSSEHDPAHATAQATGDGHVRTILKGGPADGMEIDVAHIKGGQRLAVMRGPLDLLEPEYGFGEFHAIQHPDGRSEFYQVLKYLGPETAP